MIRAAVMTAPHEPIAVWDLDEPALEPGAVLLDTVASEVCGTDVHLHHGRLAGVPYPIIPGHVSVGRVAARAGVEQDAVGRPLSIGDLVTFYDVHEVCNTCWHCTVAKQPTRCPARRVYGITYSATEGPLGGWSERIYCKPGVRLLKLPDGLAPETFIGGGCGLFTGFAAVERANVAMGDTVLVQGAGAVGLSAAAFASLRGAAQVLVIGAPRDRLTLATRLGADGTLDLDDTPEARAESVAAWTGGRGADVVIEAAGNPAAITEGFRLLRDGGTYVVAGHYTDVGEATVNFHHAVNRKHATVLGQWGSELSHWVRALALLNRHRDRLPFADVVGARYGLDDAGQALADVASLRVTKAVIVP